MKALNEFDSAVNFDWALATTTIQQFASNQLKMLA